jgi:hypothetical protein
MTEAEILKLSLFVFGTHHFFLTKITKIVLMDSSLFGWDLSKFNSTSTSGLGVIGYSV